MPACAFLPWHMETAQAWLARRERFAHAWLIHGVSGIGKEAFARAASAALLCETPADGLACGQCPACQWVNAGNHPDLRLIRPEAIALAEGEQLAQDEASDSAAAKRAPSKEIRIDQIRSLNGWFNTTTHRGGWRVAVLYPAQALNVMASNALLKVLEEPPEATLFLLVADAPDRLLPTLISRCRRLPLAAPDPLRSLQWLNEQGLADAASWLAAAGGAPLTAQRLAAQRDSPSPAWLSQLLEPLARGIRPDVGALADLLDKAPAADWIDVMQRTYVDLSFSACGQPVRYYPGLARESQAIAARADAARLSEAERWMTQQRALASHPLNAKLFAHASLLRIVAACGAS